jgi:hypothetical protein
MILCIHLPVDLGEIDGLVAGSRCGAERGLQPRNTVVVNAIGAVCRSRVGKAGVGGDLADVRILVRRSGRAGAAAGLTGGERGVGWRIEVRVGAGAGDGSCSWKVVVEAIRRKEEEDLVLPNRATDRQPKLTAKVGGLLETSTGWVTVELVAAQALSRSK